MDQYQILLKKKHRTEIINFLIGSLIYAIGFNVLVVPMGLYSGGFMGISQLIVLGLKAGLHIPIPASVNLTGIIYFVLNVPLFYMGYRVLGKKFTAKVKKMKKKTKVKITVTKKGYKTITKSYKAK